MVAAVGGAAPPRVVYVDSRASGANDGSSWEDAFYFLQDALLTAGQGDEIRVAQGRHLPQGVRIAPPPRAEADGALSVASDPSRQGMSFDLRHEGALRGGYAGLGASDPNARDVALYETILSGDLRRDDPDEAQAARLYAIPEREGNSMNVVRIDRVGPTVLDGFTIYGGQAQNGGGGLRVEHASPTVQNCTFVRNWGWDGGGVFVHRGHPTIRNCRFVSNAAMTRGAGLYVQEGSVVLAGCEFVGNVAGWAGAGAFTRDADVSVSNCAFRGNSCTNGAGLHHVRGDLHVWDSIFADNSAFLQEFRCDGRGGALYAGLSSGDESTLTGCLFARNVSCSGGAVHGDLRLARNCRFTGNLAHEDGGVVEGQGTVGFDSCLFNANLAAVRFALAKNIGPFSLTNCTAVGNSSPDGQLIHAFGGHGARVEVTVVNCIVRDTADVGGQGQSDRRWPDHTSVTYSNIQGGWPGEGNIDVDPCFAEPGYWDMSRAVTRDGQGTWSGGDYHLKSQAGRWDPRAQAWVQDEVTSLCIDAGDPLSPIGLEPFPTGGIVNMGAYGGTVEAGKSWFGGPVCETILAGDLNGDCRVDIDDYNLLALHWLRDADPVPPPPAPSQPTMRSRR
jgi:hypothetical protein